MGIGVNRQKAKPCVSVVITLFEQPLSLLLLLLCLEAQEFDQAFEVIVCDDGSSHDCFTAILNGLQGIKLDLRYIWHMKLGHRAAKTKNDGIRCARGKYLIFLDADILVKKTFLKEHVAAHVKSGLIICNPRLWTFASSQELLDDARLIGVERVLDSIAVSCFTLDRAEQRRLSRSSASWSACIGFSFSVERSDNVFFDENFEGWGPEDRELVIRLVYNHGLLVEYRDNIEVFHLENSSTGRSPLLVTRGVLPLEHERIVPYLRNMVYLSKLHPKVPLVDVLVPVIFYNLDESTNRWFLNSSRDRAASKQSLSRSLELIEAWFENEQRPVLATRE